jgi:pentatricopeptide repeat protein
LKLIDWYISNNFCCNIYIKGCLEEENIDEVLKCFTEIHNKFINIDLKPKEIYIYTKGLNLNLLKNILLIFNNSSIKIIPIFLINGYYCDKQNLYTEK